MLNRVKVTVATGKPIGHNVYCTEMLSYLLFRLMTTGGFCEEIEIRLAEQRSMEFSSMMTMLIPPLETKVWGEKRIGNKVAMAGELIGYPPKINTRRDKPCMEHYLRHVSKSGLDRPSILSKEQFLPLGAPLLEFLVEELKKEDGWKYPKLEDLKEYQVHIFTSVSYLHVGYLSSRRFHIFTSVTYLHVDFLSSRRFLIFTSVSYLHVGFLSSRRFLIFTSVI